MKINCIAIDDEPLALTYLTQCIEKTPFLQLCAQYPTPLKAIEENLLDGMDLIFLDVQTPDLNGIEFSRTLENGPKLIFVSAFEKYALEGFKVEALDYLLKPFSYEEFLRAAQKAKKFFDLLQQAQQPQNNTSKEYIFVKSEQKILKIFFEEILYIEGLKDYVKICTSTQIHLSLLTLKSIEQKLPPEQFMRVHRSFIVNLNNIETIERSRIRFGSVYIPVSDQYKDNFQKFLDNNFLS